MHIIIMKKILKKKSISKKIFLTQKMFHFY